MARAFVKGQLTAYLISRSLHRIQHQEELEQNLLAICRDVQNGSNRRAVLSLSAGGQRFGLSLKEYADFIEDVVGFGEELRRPPNR
jgi:hypothetical protein